MFTSFVFLSRRIFFTSCNFFPFWKFPIMREDYSHWYDYLCVEFDEFVTPDQSVDSPRQQSSAQLPKNWWRHSSRGGSARPPPLFHPLRDTESHRDWLNGEVVLHEGETCYVRFVCCRKKTPLSIARITERSGGERKKKMYIQTHPPPPPSCSWRRRHTNDSKARYSLFPYKPVHTTRVLHAILNRRLRTLLWNREADESAERTKLTSLGMLDTKQERVCFIEKDW